MSVGGNWVTIPYVDTTIRNEVEKINIDAILIRDVPLAPLCSYRTGGDADLLGTPSNLSELRALLAYASEHGLSITLLGGGTNVLVSDRGVRGLTILTTRLHQVHVRGTLLCAQAGLSVDKTIQIAIEHSLCGLELLGGLPGTIGGAVRGNAGANGVWLSDFVEWVDYIDMDGTLGRVFRSEMDFSYKHSCFSSNNYVIYEVVLRLIPNKETSEAMRMREQSRRKRFVAGQFDYPSAGCMFKNPEGYSAGKLIDQAKLNTLTVGGAAVSHKHANFIINRSGDATSMDMYRLSQQIAEHVEKSEHIKLEREIQLIGQW